ncbi:hypothetical protein T440DRAFT_176911 [Plenodomus tracheiphilus IPT5]|uniref:Uncharacterized protein n=1 Tax=Plenodomus tracheiphilus IPT5 TaxID=1408161 RepID=A0A6A7B0E5_9PLEO|nr:hypothetical protein T440DRAFT_176911 [Plenodomus tracheiphilus IPT5]
MSPKYAGALRPVKVFGTDLPQLQSFSDLAWLKWTATYDQEPTTMRYFLSVWITNMETLAVFENVMSEAGLASTPAWPGYEVAANTESGAAILGTPNALAFSYFLIQHKARLGHLHVFKITLFATCDGSANMLFHVEPVPKEDELL